MRTRATLRAVGLLALIAVAAILAGCGSSNSSSSSSESGGGESSTASSSGGSSGGAAAAKVVAKASAPIEEWAGFQAPFNAPTGKHIVAIECSSLGVGCVEAANATKEAGEELGWTTDVVNGKGDPTVWNSAIQGAISDKADGIVLLAISPALVEEGIAKAKAAGIPVVATLVGPPADALVVSDPQEGGEDMAAYLAGAAGGGHIFVLNDAEFVLTDERNKAMVSDLGKLCSECETTQAEFTFATMAEKLPGQVASALQSDPNVTYVTVPFDAAVTFVRQGIEQAGSSAKIASFEGDPPVLETLGDGTQAADLATPNKWVGWQSVDDLARLMASESVSDAPIPVRLFTEENAEEAKEWEGDYDFRSKYLELWGK